MINQFTPEHDRTVSRRWLLRGTGSAATVALAGCGSFGGDGGDGSDEGDGGGNAEASRDPVDDRVEVDPADIQEGGTFRTAVGENPDTFDFPFSSSASASALHNLMYEGMTTTDSTGEIYSWLASSYERVDMQERALTDYEPYMTTVTAGENGAVSADSQIVITHPEDIPAEQGDEVRVLTVNEAGDAVADGTYGMHYRFQLHEGVTFHNGEEMTAQNVVESYNRVRGSLLSGQLYDSLLDIQADGDYTVNLYAQQPDASAIRELSGFPIYPSETATLPPEQMDPRQGNTPQGTGPFQLEEFQDEGFARFSKFDDYWFDTSKKDWYDGPEDFPNGPVVDEVDVSIIPDPAQRSAALQSGELDHARGLNANTLPDFEDSEDYRLASSDGAGFTFMQYPVEVEPFNNAKIRRAINHLIPRQQIANEIFNGYENPANVPCPPIAARLGTTDYQQLQENLGSYSTYSVDRADELVEQAMEEQDIETPIEVTIRTNANNDNRVSTVELIAQAVSQSEYFEGDTETVADLVTLIGQLYQPSFAEEGIFTFVGLSGGFNPHGYAKAIHHPDNYLQCCNFQNINIERLNEGLQEARYGTDVVEDQQLRKQRYEDVWEIILEENANSYGTFSKTISVVTDAVKGFNSYPSVQDVIGYGLYSPMEQQITYLARE